MGAIRSLRIVGVVLTILLTASAPVWGQSTRRVIWPFKEAEFRTRAREQLDAREAIFQSEMTTWLSGQRSGQLAGADGSNLIAQAKSTLPRYVREVLNPRIQAAATGCRESRDAIWYWRAYWRQVQLLGEAGDGAGDLGNSDFYVTIDGRTYTSVGDMPEQLLPTMVESCLFESYQRCVATGDFVQLLQLVLSAEQQAQMLGREMEPAWIELAIGYLQRCGHW